MIVPARFSYTSKGTGGTLVPDLAPIISIELYRNRIRLDVHALVDSGADISILPYSVGMKFGVAWDSLNVSGAVSAAGGSVPGKMLLLNGRVASFAPVKLLFLWVQTDHLPLILGQSTFFREFDVCFFGSKQEFQVQPRTP